MTDPDPDPYLGGGWPVQIITGHPIDPVPQRFPGSPHQTTATDPASVGDCYRACIATLLAVPIDDVIHVQHARNLAEQAAGHELPWSDRRIAREHLRTAHVVHLDPPFGTVAVDLADISIDEAERLDVPYIVTVTSKRGPWPHAVVAHRGEVVWDPSQHPDGYTLLDDQHEPGTAVEVLALPYDPDPEAMIEHYSRTAWAAGPDASSDEAQRARSYGYGDAAHRLDLDNADG